MPVAISAQIGHRLAIVAQVTHFRLKLFFESMPEPISHPSNVCRCVAVFLRKPIEHATLSSTHAGSFAQCTRPKGQPQGASRSHVWWDRRIEEVQKSPHPWRHCPTYSSATSIWATRRSHELDLPHWTAIVRSWTLYVVFRSRPAGQLIPRAWREFPSKGFTCQVAGCCVASKHATFVFSMCRFSHCPSAHGAPTFRKTQKSWCQLATVEFSNMFFVRFPDNNFQNPL